MLGLGISLSGLLLVGFYIFSTIRQSEDALIRLRYGSMLMDVYERSLNFAMPMVEAASIDDLAKMAERQNTLILHVTLNDLHHYLVQGNGVIYRYVLGTIKNRLPERAPSRREVIEYGSDGGPYIYNAAHPKEQEVTGYVVNIRKIGFENNYPEDTEILRKIKL